MSVAAEIGQHLLRGRCDAAGMRQTMPLGNVRGHAADRLRTWIPGQTFAREPYRVLVRCDGTTPRQGRNRLAAYDIRRDVRMTSFTVTGETEPNT